MTEKSLSTLGPLALLGMLAQRVLILQRAGWDHWSSTISAHGVEGGNTERSVVCSIYWQPSDHRAEG